MSEREAQLLRGKWGVITEEGGRERDIKREGVCIRGYFRPRYIIVKPP